MLTEISMGPLHLVPRPPANRIRHQLQVGSQQHHASDTGPSIFHIPCTVHLVDMSLQIPHMLPACQAACGHHGNAQLCVHDHPNVRPWLEWTFRGSSGCRKVPRRNEKLF